MSKVIAGAALVIPPAALVPSAFLAGNDKLAKICLTLMFFYLIAWMIAGTVMLDSWLPERSRGQLPPPSAPHGPAPEREQDGGIGDDRTLRQARSGACAGHLPGHGAIRRARRSLTGRRDQPCPRTCNSPNRAGRGTCLCCST
jgi:hypothetical protein